MKGKLLTEQFAFSGGKVRRPGVDGYTGKYPVIEGVLLCGPESLNGRDYPGAAFGPSSDKLYEGRPIYVNHSATERQFQEKLGWIENEQRRADGMPIGNIGIHPLHPEAERVLWAAENKPDFAGFSHVARCDTATGANGRESVRRVIKIESTDLVVDPATTKGFYESKGRTMSKISAKVLIERIGPKLGPEKWARAKKLFEMEGVPGDLEYPEPAAEEAPDTSLEEAIITLCSAVARDAVSGKVTPEEAAEKIKAFINTHLGKANDAGEGEGEGEGDSKESRKKKAGNAIMEAVEVCEKIDYRPSSEEISIIAAIPAAKREQIAKRFKLVAEGAAGTATSGGRPGLSTGQQLKESVMPNDLSKVAW